MNRTSFTLPSPLRERLGDLSHGTGLSQSALVRLAVLRLLEDPSKFFDPACAAQKRTRRTT